MKMKKKERIYMKLADAYDPVLCKIVEKYGEAKVAVDEAENRNCDATWLAKAWREEALAEENLVKALANLDAYELLEVI